MTKTINHVGISGGKDSTALLLWAVHESGYPKESIRASFCNTGNEAEETYDYVRYLSETVHPIDWITPPLDFYELAAKKKRFPSARVRFCTELLKVKPTLAHIRQYIEAGQDVLLHAGIRAQESAKRAAMPEREWDSLYDCEVYRPLLRWTLADVWACHERYGIKRNPLYDMGMERVGCLPCVMSRKNEILQIATKFPERIDRIRTAEQDITASHPRAAVSAWMASFFAHDKVPERYRTVPVEVPVSATWDDDDNQIDGPSVKMMNVPNIDDVVLWAKERSALQEEMFEKTEHACSERHGLCE